MDITFSIVTAVRNEEESILTTLESVCEQCSQYFKVEHLLIDGASDDKTLDTISSYVEKTNQGHKNLNYQFHSEPDRGIYDAMNKGRGYALGDFLFFLNAGDKFSTPKVLETMYQTISSLKKFDVIYYGNVEITSEYTSWKRPHSLPPKELHRVQDINRLPHHQSVFYPKVFYQNQEYDINFIRYGDTEYSMLACDSFLAFYVPTDITTIRLGGFSTKKHNYKEARAIFLDYLLLAKKHPHRFSQLSISFKFLKYIVKFIIDTVLGPNVKHVLMRYFMIFTK